MVQVIEENSYIYLVSLLIISCDIIFRIIERDRFKGSDIKDAAGEANIGKRKTNGNK